jgi:hypothetical protein
VACLIVTLVVFLVLAGAGLIDAMIDLPDFRHWS